MKSNVGNERLKHGFRGWLRVANKGRKLSTVSAADRAVRMWEEYSKWTDFKKITMNSAAGFSDWLAERRTDGKPLSAATRHQTVRFVRSFYQWLLTQPCKNRQTVSRSLEYLSVDRETAQLAKSPGRRHAAPPDYPRKLADSIKDDSELGMRDRAIISFLFLSGARVTATATMPLGCFDATMGKAYQDPKSGVKTKNSKYIETTLWKFDPTLMAFLVKWALYLRETKGFGDADPLFPATKSPGSAKEIGRVPTEVEAKFWVDGSQITKILKQRALDVGIKPQECHAIRHLVAQLALSKCPSDRERKAVSQNLGHAHAVTTVDVYGHLEQNIVDEVVANMEFSDKASSKPSRAQREMLMRLLDSMDLTEDNE